MLGMMSQMKGTEGASLLDSRILKVVSSLKMDHNHV